MRKALPALILLSLCVSVSVAPAQTQCTIDDDEEYAVLGAVLFPEPPDIPNRMSHDPQREAHQASMRFRLDGFHGNSYSILDETMPSEFVKVPDQFMAEGYSQKNEQTCRIVSEKLLAHVPPGRHVALLITEEIRSTFSGSGKDGGWEAFRRKHPLAEGITSLSRPALNRDHTEAMVEARHQAGYHMGVGYRVHLKKSPRTGKWVITGAEMTRMS